MTLKAENAAGKGVVTSIISRALTIIGPVILIPMYVRYLSIEEYGYWIIILSITSYFNLANIGITQAVSNAVARDISTEKTTYYNQVASSGYYLFQKITLSILFISIIVFISIQIFPKNPPFKNELMPLMITVGALLLSFPIYIYRSVLRGLDHIHKEQIAEMIGTVFRYIAVIISLLSGFKIIALSIIFGTAYFVPSLVAKNFLRKLISSFKISRLNLDSQTTKNLMKPTTSFLILLLGGTLLFGIDNIVIGSILGIEFVPQYAVPMQIIWGVFAMLILFSKVKMPFIAGKYKEGKFGDLKNTYQTLLFFSMMGASIIIINLIITGEIIISTWAGAEIFPGGQVFYLMLFFLFLWTTRIPADAVLTAAEKHSGYAYMTVIEGVVNATLTILLVYKMGIQGAIIATILAHLLTNGWFITYKTLKVIKYGIFDFLQWLMKNIVVPIIVLFTLIFYVSRLDIFVDSSTYMQLIICNFLILLFVSLVSKKNILNLVRTFNDTKLEIK